MESIISSRGATERPLHSRMMGAVWLRPRLSCITSLGIILPAAAREMILSRSPISEISPWRVRRSSCCFVKCSTTSYLSRSSFRSITGIARYDRSSLAPIGDEHLSITSISATPSLPAVDVNISRLRKVNLSIQTKLFSSILEMEQMFFSPTCCACSR